MATIYVITLEMAQYNLKNGDKCTQKEIQNIGAFTSIDKAREHLFTLGKNYLPVLKRPDNRIIYSGDVLLICDYGEKTKLEHKYTISEMDLKEDK
jgi:hypothetical protein